MGIDATAGVRTRLAGNAPLCASLALYGGAPAILTEPVADDYEVAVAPSIIVGEPILNDADDTFTDGGRDVQLRVRIYSKHGGSSIAINAVAEAARALLHNWFTPTFPGGNLLASLVSGPVAGPTSDPSIEGRLLTVSLKIKEA
jgi:hypothetical protein